MKINEKFKKLLKSNDDLALELLLLGHQETKTSFDVRKVKEE